MVNVPSARLSNVSPRLTNVTLAPGWTARGAMIPRLARNAAMPLERANSAIQLSQFGGQVSLGHRVDVGVHHTLARVDERQPHLGTLVRPPADGALRRPVDDELGSAVLTTAGVRHLTAELLMRARFRSPRMRASDRVARTSSGASSRRRAASPRRRS